MADSMKKYILMHKDVPVADMELDEASCAISAIGHVYADHHVPVGIPVKKGVIDRTALNEWWKGRAIPASRAGIKSALVELNLTTTQSCLRSVWDSACPTSIGFVRLIPVSSGHRWISLTIHFLMMWAIFCLERVCPATI